MSSTTYSIRYYRNQEWSQRWAAIGVDKPPGWVVSPHHNPSRLDMLKLVDHINQQKPDYPCELVTIYNGIERD